MNPAFFAYFVFLVENLRKLISFVIFVGLVCIVVAFIYYAKGQVAAKDTIKSFVIKVLILMIILAFIPDKDTLIKIFIFG